MIAAPMQYGSGTTGAGVTEARFAPWGTPVQPPVHDDLTPVAERQVPAAGQLVQARGHLRDLDAEFPGQLAGIRRPSGPGERPVHRQPQILSVHDAIFASPMNTRAGRRLSE
jgi:hypothetical protein